MSRDNHRVFLTIEQEISILEEDLNYLRRCSDPKTVDEIIRLENILQYKKQLLETHRQVIREISTTVNRKE